MLKFSAVAYDTHGRTFVFHFTNANWNGAEAAARAALNTLGYDSWSFRSIDRA